MYLNFDKERFELQFVELEHQRDKDTAKLLLDRIDQRRAGRIGGVLRAIVEARNAQP